METDKKSYSIFVRQDGSKTSMVVKGFLKAIAYIFESLEVTGHNNGLLNNE